MIRLLFLFLIFLLAWLLVRRLIGFFVGLVREPPRPDRFPGDQGGPPWPGGPAPFRDEKDITHRVRVMEERSGEKSGESR